MTDKFFPVTSPLSEIRDPSLLTPKVDVLKPPMNSVGVITVYN